MVYTKLSAVSYQLPVGSLHSRQLAVFSRHCHERKNLAFQARQIELPRLSRRGPLMISWQSSVSSSQSAVLSLQCLVLE